MHKIQLLGLTLVFIGGLNGAAAEIAAQIKHLLEK